jgi:WD40 repeat protein
VEAVGRWRIADHADLVNAVAFGPDWVATGSQDKTIVVRDGNGKPLRTLSGHTAGVLALAASPDGTRLVSSGVDRTIRVWNPATGELLRTITNHGDRVGALAFSPDGKYLASGSRDRSVRIWQPEIGRLVRIVKHHDGEILDLAWTDILVSACSDGKVRHIDTDTIVKEYDAGGYIHAVAVTSKEILAVSSKLHRWVR